MIVRLHKSINSTPAHIISAKGADNMKNGEKPQIPLGLGYALAENTSALKYFSELSAEKQRSVIDRAGSISSRAELRSFVRNMAGLGNIY